MKPTSLFTDSRVQATIAGREWHIDLQYGLSALGRYLTNLEMADSGARDVSAFERLKDLNAPAILDTQGNVLQVGPSSVLRGNAPQGSILRLNLIGPMFANGDLCSWGMDDYEDVMAMANENSNIDGIFIRANTGGGESLAGQILHNAVKSSKKAVVVYADFLGSAGVLGTVAADEIIASGPGSRIGSIGAYFSIDKSFAEWYKENVDDIYADVSTDKNADWNAYLQGDSGPLKKVATESARIFQEVVKTFRNLKGDAESTLRGGMFFANDAKKRGLIDSTGTLDYAFARLKSAIKRRKNNM